MKIVKLKDISVNNRGYYGIGASAVDYDADKYTYLRITDINDDGSLNKKDLMSVDDEKANQYLLQKNDIVFARTGASTGRNYFYDGEIENMVYAGFLIKFSLNSNLVNPKYIKYYCLSKRYNNWILSSITGSTRPNINEKQLANMPIELPEREYQDKVVKIIDALTNKIKLNNEINNNLYEEMQALYNEWFKKFNPFKNNSFKDTVLGKIPEKFTIEDIYSISKVIYGAPFKSNLFNEEKNGKPIIRIRDLKNQNMKTYTSENHPKGYLLQKGDIIVGMDGEFRPYFWGNDEAWLNQRVCVFDNKRKKGKAFLYYTLKPLLDFIEKTEVGTTVIHIGKNDFDKFKIILPDEDTLDKFDEITNPMVWQMVRNMVQNHRLENLRDTLLPKLMNGEIDLDNIEI